MREDLKRGKYNKQVVLRPQKRDGLLGTGKRGVGKGRKSEWQSGPQKTEEAVNHRQNNYVKAV